MESKIMDNKINDILYKLRDGSIDVNKTIKEIDSIQYDVRLKEVPKKRARKLKILINAIDDKDGKNFKLNLPGLPFWFLKSFCVPFIKFAVKHSGSKGDKGDNGDKIKGIKADDIKNLKFIFDALGQMPPFEIVNVDSKDAKVHIYTK
jgi:hypothetical protein